MVTVGTVRFVFATLLLMSGPALAQSVVPAVLDAQGMPDATVKRLTRAAADSLKALSALKVGDPAPWRKDSPKKNCASTDCQQDVVKAVPSPVVLLLSFKGQGAFITVDASLWLEGERVAAKSGDLELDSAEVGFKPVIEAVLPAWARKGWGGLRLDTDAGAVVKLDGRATRYRPGEVLAVPAGPHQLDVVFADGNAVLQRVDVPEGSRLRVDVAPAQGVVTETSGSGLSTIRAVSYGLFAAGTLAIAGGLVAGTLSRQTGAGQNSCMGDSRSCVTFETAAEKQRQSAGYATTGNVFLGTGLALVATGVGLFVYDAVREKSP